MYNEHNVFSVKLGGESIQLPLELNQYQRKHLWSTKRHSHATYEVHILLGGSCVFDIESASEKLHAGQALLIAPGQYHQTLQPEGEFSRFTALFSPSAVLGRRLRQYAAGKPFAVGESVTALCNEIFFECAAGNGYKSDRLQALLTLLCIDLLRSLDLTEANRGVQQSKTDLHRIGYIDEFFEANFALNEGEELLARNMHLSKRQLSRVLQKYYGMGYRQKLICARMDHAAWLLRSSDTPVFRIAETVGYSSESAFFQVFRRHFQMTPQQYRIQSGYSNTK